MTLGLAGEDLVLVHTTPACCVALGTWLPLPHPSRCIFTMLGGFFLRVPAGSDSLCHCVLRASVTVMASHLPL